MLSEPLYQIGVYYLQQKFHQKLPPINGVKQPYLNWTTAIKNEYTNLLDLFVPLT